MMTDRDWRRPVFRMISYQCSVMLFLIGGALSAITSSPGIKRVYEGESCALQWTFTGIASYYNFQNLTTASPSSVRGTVAVSQASGVITLTITNIALWDAGNYSLTIGNTNDTTALLYVYQIPQTPVIDNFEYLAQFPVVEQKSISIRCSVGLTSRPSSYSPQILYTFTRDGDEIFNQSNRHSISGYRLTVNPVLRADDGRLYRCKAQEVGSRLESNYSEVFNLSLHEFKSVPFEFQRKNEQEDLSLKWELSYNVCSVKRNMLYDFFSFYIQLTHSIYGTIATIRFDPFNYYRGCIKYASLNSAFTNRASFTTDHYSVTFYLANVLTNDAGYFTLELSHEASGYVQQNSSALFVYGYPSLTMMMSPNINKVPKGYSVELTCSANPNSLPSIYRQAMIYAWGRLEDNHVGPFQVGSNVALEDGTVIDRYSLTNYNRTLRISSVDFSDNTNFYCTAMESGSTKKGLSYYNLNTEYAPVIASTIPLTRKVNVNAPKMVTLRVNFYANPFPATMPSWRFVDLNGVGQLLPPSAAFADWYSMQFIVSSESEYGNYTYRVNNTYGITETTFQVLPPAKPDNPINFQAYYLTSASVFLQWNCSWDNGLQQFFIVQLRERADKTVIETKNVTSPIGCPSNVTIQVKFETNIQPETDYEASLWSYNDLGSSAVIEQSVRTSARPTLLVPSKNIVLNGTNAHISYSIVKGSAVQMKVECCVESKLVCVRSFFNVSSGDGSITVGNLPSDGNQYTFDFYLYDGPPHNLSLVAYVRNVAGDDGGSSNTSLLPAVIALAILFGLSLAAAVGMLIAFITIRRRSKIPAQRTTRQNDYVTPEGVANPAVTDSASDGEPIQPIYEGLAEPERYQEPQQLTYECLRIEEKTKGRSN